jgi:hypothetical protein
MRAKYKNIPYRKLFVILKKRITIEGKKYLRIVAIDIRSGKLCLIVDNNGKPEEGLHSFNNGIDKIKEMSVIEAKFIPITSKNILDLTYKIVSPFRVAATGGDLNLYVKKADEIEQLMCIINRFLDDKVGVVRRDAYSDVIGSGVVAVPHVIHEDAATNRLLQFGRVPNKYQDSQTKLNYLLVASHGVQIIDGKLSLTIHNIPIVDVDMNKRVVEGNFFTGLTLLALVPTGGGMAQAEKLYGVFTTGEEIPELKYMANPLVENLSDRWWEDYEAVVDDYEEAMQESNDATNLDIEEFRDIELDRLIKNVFDFISSNITYKTINPDEDDFAVEY